MFIDLLVGFGFSQYYLTHKLSEWNAFIRLNIYYIYKRTLVLNHNKSSKIGFCSYYKFSIKMAKVEKHLQVNIVIITRSFYMFKNKLKFS